MRLNAGVVRTSIRRMLGSEESRRFRSVEAAYQKLVTRRTGAVSYSQFGEDRLLRALFSEPVGTYVDIGAGEPASGSNTFLFYRSGWSGFLVDPVSRYQRWSGAVRPLDRFELAICSRTLGAQDFYEFEQAQFSTTDSARARELVTAGRKLARSYQVRSLAIADLPVECSPTDACFFSIDVEGAEMSVLESVNWERTRPGAICVEELVFRVDEPSEVGRYLSARGYRLEGRVGLSSIYVHDDSGRGIRAV